MIKKIHKNFFVLFFIFLLTFNIYSLSNTVYGFETANRIGDIEGAYLDDLSKIVGKSKIASHFLHAGRPIHQEITQEGLKFLKPDIIKLVLGSYVS